PTCAPPPIHVLLFKRQLTRGKPLTSICCFWRATCVTPLPTTIFASHQGATDNAWHNSLNRFDPVTSRRRTDMASQPQLGLRSQRRRRADPGDRFDPRSAPPHLRRH